MEPFSEREKEALLNEINQIKEVLCADQSFRKVEFDQSEEESADDEDSLDDEYEDEEDFDSFSHSKTSSAWMSHGLSESLHDENPHESHATVDILEKTKAVLQQAAFPQTPSSGLPSLLLSSHMFDTLKGKSLGGTSSSSFQETQLHSFDKSNNGASIANSNLGSLEWALQLNRDYQEIVKDELVRINCALRNNRSMQAEVESRSEERQNPRRHGYSFLARFRPTYLKDRFGEGPPDNVDSKERKALRKVHPYFHITKLWTAKERRLLAEGIENQNLERMTLSLKETINQLKKEAKKGEDKQIERKIKAVEKKLQDLKSLPKSELRRSLEDLDFESISRLYLPQRTEKECRIRWLNIEHPCINQSKWTKEEDTKLVSLARKYNNRNWEKIAQDLRTFRTPVQCFQRFQRSLNKDIVKGPWTESEDEELCNAVKVCPKGSWVQVAGMLEGRLPMQCLNRYEKAIQPGLKKGRWTKEENELLVKYCNIYGVGKWKKISQHIPGRNDCSCRERWVNFYRPDLKLRRKWSKKEDIQLLEAVAKYGFGKWTQVSKGVPGRTDSMCWRRYRLIQKEEYDVYREKIKKKNELLNYFVHRNHEIPNVDFDQLDLGTGPSDEKSNQDKPQSNSGVGNSSRPKRRKRRTLQQRKINVGKRRSNQSKDGHGDEQVLSDGDGLTSEDFTEEEATEEEATEEETNDSFSDAELNKKNKQKKDPDYHFPGNRSSDENEFVDSRCESILEAGERLLGRYESEVATYVDVKRELFLLKVQIDKLEDSEEKSKLIRLNQNQFKELEELSSLRKKREGENRVRYKRLMLTYPIVDPKDTVHGPPNLGIRPMRPVDISNMPGNLGPFTILLEVFKIDYANIMKRMQEAATTTPPSSGPAGGNPSDASTSDGASKRKQSKGADTTGSKVVPSFPQIIPIAPNLVTLKAFRQLLLHRQRLVQLSARPTDKKGNTEREDPNPPSGSREINDQSTESFKIIAKSSSIESNSTSGDFNPHAVKSEFGSNEARPTSQTPCKMDGLPSTLATQLQSSLATKDNALRKASFKGTQDYAALSARFNCLFLWPALLSAHPARIPDLKESKLKMATSSSSGRKRRNHESGMDVKAKRIAKATTATIADADKRNELMWNRVIRDTKVSQPQEDNTTIGSDLKTKVTRKAPKIRAKRSQKSRKLEVKKIRKRGSKKPLPKTSKENNTDHSSESDNDPDFGVDGNGRYEPRATLGPNDGAAIGKESLRSKRATAKAKPA